MSGRLKICNQNYIKTKHDHFIIKLHNKISLIFNDPRKFGFIDFVKNNEIYKKLYYEFRYRCIKY